MSIMHWLIVLAVVILIFGTGKIKALGKDMGEAIHGLKDGFREADDAAEELRKLDRKD
jgi:sec-independent protein translocase protein TatA